MSPRENRGLFDWVALIGLWLAALSLVLATALIFYALISHTHCSLEHSTSFNNIPSSDDKKWCSVFNDPTAVFTALIAAFTLVLAWGTIKLMTGAEDTSERQLRAYVFLDDAVLEQDAGGGFTGRILLKFKNFGKTPARKAIIKTETKAGEEGLSLTVLPLTTKAETHPPITIPPGKHSTIIFYCPDWAKRAEMLFLWGRIDYIDSFGKERFTAFQMCQTIGGNIASFGFCKTGNEDN